jgi:hypothetical protein
LTCGRQPGRAGCVLIHEVLVTQAFRSRRLKERRETTLSRKGRK